MNKNVQSAVLGYVAQESDQQELLGEGTHIVSIAEWKVLHSRIKWNGEEKAKLPDFSDPTAQLGLMFKNDDGNLAFYRANMMGYRRWEDLTEAEQTSDKYERVTFGDQVYACKLIKGKLVRVTDKKRTAGAHSIVDQIMASVGMTGQSIGDAMDTVVGNATKLSITIVEEEYDGKTQYKVKSFSKVKEAVSDFGD